MVQKDNPPKGTENGQVGDGSGFVRQSASEEQKGVAASDPGKSQGQVQKKIRKPSSAKEPNKRKGPKTEKPAGPGSPGPKQGGGPKLGSPGGPGGGNQQKIEVVEVKPLAEPAQMKRRHWGLILSFVGLVLLPLMLTGAYLWTVAEEQYGSVTGFTVRQEEGNSASELLGGIAEFAGAGSASGDTDILYEFIQSQDLVTLIDEKLDLRGHYTQHWPGDPVFALWPEASIEDLLWYWKRIVRVSYDQSTGLVELRVLAFDPEMSQRIAREIVTESQDLVNELNAQSRRDTIRYSEDDLKEAQERLREAREALTRFRTRTQIVDPQSDIQGRMGVVNNLQQQLAQALIEYDLLLEGTNENDPRISQAQRRIDVIRERIAEERDTFTSNKDGVMDQDYPTLMAEFESLTVDREFAEQNYRAALTALSSARSQATRQSRYLATYQTPTLPQSAEYPRRWTLFGLAALFLVLAWAIMALIYYSIRDRS